MTTYTFSFLTASGAEALPSEFIECPSDADALGKGLSRLEQCRDGLVLEVRAGSRILIRLGERLFGASA